MNREQKGAAIAEIAAQIKEAQAILAVDYRGISVPQAAELRAGLRQADATFRVVKNSLTERAADESGAETLKPLLTGPTALAFVRGDVATAAKTIADYGRATQLLPFKGGLMDGATLDVEQIRSLSRLPSREVLYGQLVGVVASPVSGLVRSLGALLGGLAVALGQVREQLAEREPSGAATPAATPEAGGGTDDAEAAEQLAGSAETEPAATEGAPAPAAEQSPAEEPATDESARAVAADEQRAPAAEAPQAETAESAAAEDSGPADEQQAQAAAEEAPAAEEPAAEAVQKETEPDEGPAQQDDDEADASVKALNGGAEAKPAKED
jgi:large subunit ribosomal protein L10